MTPSRLLLAALLSLFCASAAVAQTEPAPAPQPAASAQPEASANAAGTAGPMPLATGAAAPDRPASTETPEAVAPAPQQAVRTAAPEPAAAAGDAPTAAVVAQRAPQSLVVGISDSAPPFSTVSQFGVRGGFDVDVALAVCSRINADCRLVPLLPSEMVPALKERRVDFIVASGGGLERFADVATFTNPYVSLVARYVVPRDSSVDLEAEDKAKLGAVIDTIYAQYLEKTYERPGTVRLYDGASPMWIDLALGRLDAALATAVTARKEFLGTPLGEAFRLSSVPLRDSSIGSREAAIAVRKSEDALTADLNAALADYIASPEYQEALAKHLAGGLADAPAPPKAATGG